MTRVVEIIAALAIAQAAGLIGSMFTTPAIDGWYATLVRPDIAPPNWVFAPVWTTLFVLMGIASYLVWRKRKEIKGAATALWLYGIQLVFNVLWSICFFGLQNPGLALIEIGVLWLLILGTIITFWRVSRVAALLLVPYILWVSFASVLNYQFWILN